MMTAKWITYPGKAKQKNFYFRARRLFNLDAVPENLQLHIAAESYYRLYLNGYELGRGPARGSRTLNYFDIYEISSYLRPGKNCVAVLVQSMNIPNFNTVPVCAGLWVKMGNICTGDGKWEVLAADDEWLQESDILCNQTGFAEFRDLRRSPVGWMDGTDESMWQNAQITVDPESKELLPRPIPMLTINRYLPCDISHSAKVEALAAATGPAEAITESRHYEIDGELTAKCQPLLMAGKHDVVADAPENGAGISLVLDFKREIIGFLELELSVPAGTIIDIGYDEVLEDGHIKAMRGTNETYRFADRFTAREGRQTVGSTLHERGFRFVEIVIRNFNTPVTLHKVEALDRRYPLPRRAEFNCSNAQLNRIWEVCIETMSACTTDVFTDCPWRERAFWVNDLMIENIVALQAFGDYRLNAHALRLALSNRHDDGLVPGVCPDDGRARIVLVPTNLFLVLMLRDYYLYSDDSKLVEELLPALQNILRIFESWEDENHLLQVPPKYWNFFDWSFELNKMSMDGKNTSLLNWLYVYALNTAAQLKEVSDPEAARKLREKSTKVVAGIEKLFIRTGQNYYSDWLETDGTPSEHASQLAQAFALLSGSCPKSRQDDLLAALDDTKLLQPELYLHHFVLEAMREHGLHDAALGRIRRYWGEMIKSGTSTLWEAAIHQQGKAAFGNIGSMCHGFGATPINYFQASILGVVPLKPGFRCFSVAPCAHDLDFAEGSIPTPSGNIRIRWQRDTGKIKVQLFVPCGLKAQTSIGDFSDGNHEFELKQCGAIQCRKENDYA